jgi:hypothetical protein
VRAPPLRCSGAWRDVSLPGGWECILHSAQLWHLHAEPAAMACARWPRLCAAWFQCGTRNVEGKFGQAKLIRREGVFVAAVWQLNDVRLCMQGLYVNVTDSRWDLKFKKNRWQFTYNLQ